MPRATTHLRLASAPALAALLLLLSSPSPSRADCVIKQNCTNGNGCRPVPVEPWETKPFNITGKLTCPQYASGGCCTEQQNTLLFVNFLSIKSAFAEQANGGCPACAQNAFLFWCAYTCSPDQDKIVTVVGVENVPDPTRAGEITEVLHTSVAVHPNFTCSTYESCERVKTVTLTSAMSNAEGFFAYQGQYEAIQHGAYIDFEYTKENPYAINPTPFSCCNFVDADNPQLGNQSCPCAYCKGMCSGDAGCPGAGQGGAGGTTLGEVTTTWATGFAGDVAGGVWGAALVLGLSVTWWRWRSDKRAAEERRKGRERERGGGAAAPKFSAAGAGRASDYLALPSK
jgi:hypothetical protein